MKKLRGKRLTAVMTGVGIGLITLATVMVLFMQLTSIRAEKRSKEIINLMYSLMPEVKGGAFDDRINITMPSIEIDGENFCGIIDIPAYQCTLPVGSAWQKGNKIAKYPHRYTGSLYDKSLIIGGSDNEGQFDFMKVISLSDYVYFIDTTGARFTYVVTEIENTKDVTTANLTSKDADLVFFAGNTYSLDYTVVRCKVHVGNAYN